MQCVVNLIYAGLLFILISFTDVNALETSFTGTKSCINCHADQHQEWQGPLTFQDVFC